jgi:hypothetical protein
MNLFIPILFDFWLVEKYEFEKSRNHLLHVRRGMGFGYYAWWKLLSKILLKCWLSLTLSILCLVETSIQNSPQMLAVIDTFNFMHSLFLDNLCVFLLLGSFHVIERLKNLNQF